MTGVPASAPRYLFSGHAIGAAAQFHRLNDTHNLNHVVPTLGASVLPSTGGLSKGVVRDFSFDVDQPRRRNLLVVRRIETSVAGRDLGTKYETELEAEVEAIHVIDKLHIDRVAMHMLSTFEPGRNEPVVTTRGNHIEGLRLGSVEARVELDDEPLAACGNKTQLAGFYRSKGAAYRRQNAWRFRTDPEAAEIAGHGPHYQWSLVRKIELTGPENEKQTMHVEGYTIVWEGFGKIILGEIHLKGSDRQLTMVRLAMGSEDGGSGSVGDGQSNGHTSG